MTCHRPETITAIDWTTGFVWVARRGLVTIAAQDPAADTVTLAREDGSRLTLHRLHFEALYQPAGDGERFKPVYEPVKARAMPGPVTVEIGGEARRLEAGDALLQMPDGSLKAVPVAEYRRDYSAVSRPDDSRYPAVPFP